MLQKIEKDNLNTSNQLSEESSADQEDFEDSAAATIATKPNESSDDKIVLPEIRLSQTIS